MWYLHFVTLGLLSLVSFPEIIGAEAGLLPTLPISMPPFSPFPAPPKNLPDLYEASIAELQAGLIKGEFTSVDLVKV